MVCLVAATIQIPPHLVMHQILYLAGTNDAVTNMDYKDAVNLLFLIHAVTSMVPLDVVKPLLENPAVTNMAYPHAVGSRLGHLAAAITESLDVADIHFPKSVVTNLVNQDADVGYLCMHSAANVTACLGAVNLPFEPPAVPSMAYQAVVTFLLQKQDVTQTGIAVSLQYEPRAAAVNHPDAVVADFEV